MLTLLRRSFAGLAVAAALLLVPGLALADTSTTLTVVGTSDVSDSNLMANVIQPGFTAAFPQYTFKYVGTATGTAITNAKTGVGGPSVLIVHAASLENQFVADGYSYEAYGRAIFTNDFVLAGPSAKPDPAGVLASAPHDIVAAFAAVATAGAAGNAEFASRAGSPGTTVAEHQIWQLVAALPSPPAGLLLCTVSPANGGGATPIAAGQGVTASGQACPATTFTPPPWYYINSLTQGPNVVFANACSGAPGLQAGHCYVFTDRGTYASLASSGTIPNLQIVTRDNGATAPGGATQLINYFHAYVINPAKFTGQPNIQINLPAALAFVNYLTSPAFQSQLKSYLNGSNDPPFVADASPIITAAGIPAVDPPGARVTVTGSVINAEPGFPPLANVPVTVSQLTSGLPVPVGSGSTDANGHYSIGFAPTSSGNFQVSTGLITQIEIASLNPPFGDLLQPAASAISAMSVQGGVTITSATPTTGGIVVGGTVGPGASHAQGTVSILARPKGSTRDFAQIGGASLAPTQTTFSITAALAPGTWQVEAIFRDPTQVIGGTSTPVDVTVPATSKGSGTVSLKKASVKNGALTLSGSLAAAPGASGAYVRLLGRHTQALTGSKKKSTGKKLSRLSTLKLGRASTSFTFHVHLKRGYRWALELEYVQPGHKATFSKQSSISVP